MMAKNHDDQLGEIHLTMLNELNCTFGISFSRFHCCGRHGIGPRMSAAYGCGRHGLWPSLFRIWRFNSPFALGGHF